MTSPIRIRPTCHRVSRSANANAAPTTPVKDIVVFYVATTGSNASRKKAPAAGATSYRLITATGGDLGGTTIHRNAIETTTVREGIISLLYAVRAFRRAHPDFAGHYLVLSNNCDLAKDISMARRVWQHKDWLTETGSPVRHKNLLAAMMTLLPENAPVQYHPATSATHVPGSREATDWANEEYRRISLITAAIAAA